MASSPTASRYLDLHLLHPVTAANLNRGESGQPKTINLGDATRGMVSPAAWRRVTRESMEADLGESAAHTRMVPLAVADALHEQGWPDDLVQFTAAQIPQSAKEGGLKTNPREGHRTQAMLFLPDDAAGRLLQICIDHREDLEQALAEQNATGKKAPAVLPRAKIAAELIRRTATINLFGRMLAEIPQGHVEGAVQMAPAFTVHKAPLQPDFFTAVEDWPRPGEAGSAHLETAFLTAGVFYRFTSVNITTLTGSLHGDSAATAKLIELFVSTFILSMPKGKQTSTAAQTIPDVVYYAVRDRRPVSFGAAFEQPVTAQGQGYTLPARQRLAEYAATIDRLLGTRYRLAHGHATAAGKAIAHLGAHHPSFADLAAECAASAFAPAAPHGDAAPTGQGSAA